jgi:hypothetical protein
MTIWGKIRELAMRDVGVLPPGRDLTAQAVVEVILGLTVIAVSLALLDYRAPDPIGILYCFAGLFAIIKGIYDFTR